MKKFILISILSILLTNFITIFSSQLDSNEDEPYIATFSYNNMTIEVEGTTYAIQR